MSHAVVKLAGRKHRRGCHWKRRMKIRKTRADPLPSWPDDEGINIVSTIKDGVL